MKLSTYVSNFIADLGIRHVFGVVGGGAMYLNDAFGNHDKLKFIATHHEQAASFAADAYARVNGIACCLATTGPGGSNCITGVMASWIDSIPVVYISGQVPTHNMIGNSGVRQMGVQEGDIVGLVKPITKWAGTVTDAKTIRWKLEMAVHLATIGRKGPVLIDIPLDIQSKQVEPSELVGFNGYRSEPHQPPVVRYIPDCLTMLRAAKRPVLIVGNGIRLAGAVDELRALADELGIPIVSSWLGSDMIADHPNHIGHCGLFGDRASNFVVQNADMLLVIGCRLSVPQIGYNFKAFASKAKIVMVDIDEREIRKPSLNVEYGIVADAKAFIVELTRSLQSSPYSDFEYGWLCGQYADNPDLVVNRILPWLGCCKHWRSYYPIILPEYANEPNGINSFYFVSMLSDKLPDDAIVVLGTGTAFTCVYQTAKMKRGQRWISNAGHSAMGWALPAAIGAAFATGKKIICIVGDGDLQFNVQELATIARHRLPVTIFVINNGGYRTITAMQDNHFARRVGSDFESGVGFPNLFRLAQAYWIDYLKPSSIRMLQDHIGNYVQKGDRPEIIEIMMPRTQQLIPRVASRKLPDGSVASTDISDMSPHLPREEYEAVMKVGE